MLFGVTSAPEEFQRRQHCVIENLPGVGAIHDDILLIGNDDTHEEAQRGHYEINEINEIIIKKLLHMAPRRLLQMLL